MSTAPVHRLLDVDRPPGTAPARPPVVVVRVQGPLAAHAARGVVERVRARLVDGATVVCELHGAADLGVVDVLARLRLLARRQGCEVRVRGAGDDVLTLLALTGLRAGGAAPLQPGGQAEAGEQPRVEEVVHVDHLPG